MKQIYSHLKIIEQRIDFDDVWGNFENPKSEAYKTPKKWNLKNIPKIYYLKIKWFDKRIW
jgi:hypothetical protein